MKGTLSVCFGEDFEKFIHITNRKIVAAPRRYRLPRPMESFERDMFSRGLSSRVFSKCCGVFGVLKRGTGYAMVTESGNDYLFPSNLSTMLLWISSECFRGKTRSEEGRLTKCNPLLPGQERIGTGPGVFCGVYDTGKRCQPCNTLKHFTMQQTIRFLRSTPPVDRRELEDVLPSFGRLFLADKAGHGRLLVSGYLYLTLSHAVQTGFLCTFYMYHNSGISRDVF